MSNRPSRTDYVGRAGYASMDRTPPRTDGGRDRRAEENERTGDGDDSDSTVEELLRANDVLEETPDGIDVQLTDAFARAWHERMDQMRGGNRALRWLAAARGIDPDEITVSEETDRFVVTHEGETVGAWHSEAGFLAAIVAEPTLKEWIPAERLENLPETEREDLAARLTMCLEQCPTCGEALAFVERVGSEGETRVALECTDCSATVVVGTDQR